jgi:hypothetical protein
LLVPLSKLFGRTLRFEKKLEYYGSGVFHNNAERNIKVSYGNMQILGSEKT